MLIGHIKVPLVSDSSLLLGLSPVWVLSRLFLINCGLGGMIVSHLEAKHRI